MARTKKKRSFGWFLLGMFLYAVLFLGLTAWGLSHFWTYIDAYEQSRPETAMNAYMEQVDHEYLLSKATASTVEIDWNLQNAKLYRDCVMETLTGEITYAKKLSECSDLQNVYMLLCGSRTVGKIKLSPLPADEYGFTPWEVTEESFDFSYLMANTTQITITVPHDYPVYVDGIALSSNYVVGSEIYEELEAFYNSNLTLPYLYTYQAGPFLGEMEVTVTDPSGNPVVIDETTDMSAFLNNCTPEKNTMLQGFVEEFLPKYVDFTSNAGANPKRNYNRLVAYMIPDSDLADRMYESISGLKWITDRKSKITAIEFNHFIDVGLQRYLCDVTYTVDTSDFSGATQAIVCLKLIIYETDNGLKVEGMTSY